MPHIDKILEFARQFMSQSTSWIDCLVFSLAPLGIITAIVGAIRVGGPSWLKALIGRARETFATAEMENLSSTSHEVCECWNGSTIVRVMGVPRILEVLFFKDKYEEEERNRYRGDRSFGLYTIEDAEENDILTHYSWENHDETAGDNTVVEGKAGAQYDVGAQDMELPGKPLVLYMYARKLRFMQAENFGSRIRLAAERLPQTINPRFLGLRRSQRQKTDEEKAESYPEKSSTVVTATENSRQGNSATAKRGTGPLSRGVSANSNKSKNGKKLKPSPIRAPNLSLNVSPDKDGPAYELYLAAFLGVVVQAIVLVFAGLVSYADPWRHRFRKGNGAAQAYAFPLTCAGTLTLALGMFLATYVIEQRSKETEWVCKKEASNTDDWDRVSAIATSVANRLPHETLHSSSSAVALSVNVAAATLRIPINNLTSPSAATPSSGSDEPEKRPPPSNTKDSGKIQILWLQGRKTVNDQSFESYVVIGQGTRDCILTSRRFEYSTTKKQKEYENSYGKLWKFLCKVGRVKPGNYLAVYTLLGTIISLVGFVSQFMGLRANHFLVSVLQLVATIFMTAVRAWIRRGLTRHPGSKKLYTQFELDWFATRFAAGAGGERGPWGCGNTGDETDLIWDIIPVTASNKHQGAWEQEPPASTSGSAQRVVEVRQRLAKLSKWTGPATKPAISVSKAIRIVMERLTREKQFEAKQLFTWSMQVRWTDRKEDITLTIRNQKDRWKVDEAQIESIISLCLLSHETRLEAELNEERTNEEGSDEADDIDDWLHPGQHIRALYPHTEDSHLAFQWWIDDGREQKIIRKELPKIQLKRGYHGTFLSRVFGFSTLDIASTSGSDKVEYLVAVSNRPLAQLLAQQIFSAFMWAIAESVKPFDADMPIESSINTNAGGYPRVRNDKLDKLVESIVQTTDLGTPDEIYLALIPPLSKRNKLFEADCIIQHAHSRASGYKSLPEEWAHASEVYIQLFETGLKFGPASKIAVKTTIALVEFLSFINTRARQHQLRHHGTSHRYSISEKLKKDITERLQDADRDVVLDLADLYKKEGILDEWKKRDQNETMKADGNAKTDRACGEAKNLKAMRDILGRNRFHRAARNNEVDVDFTVRPTDSMAEGENDVNAKDFLDRTPLHYSVCHKDGKAAKLLIRKGAKLNKRDRNRCIPLHYACQENFGTTDTIKLLLDSDSDRNARDIYGRSPLHHAAVNGCKLQVKYLLKRGADKNQTDDFGMLSLHLAACHGHSDIIELLIGHDKNAVDGSGKSALHLSALGGHKDVISTLLKAGVNKDADDDDGRSALHLAALAGHDNVVLTLLEAGLKKGDESGRTALHLAALGGHQSAVAILLKVGLEKEAKDKDGRTPLHLGAQGGHPGTITTLLEAEADKEVQDGSGLTPLHVAVLGNHEEAVDKLLAGGSNANARDEEGCVPSHIAASRGLESIIRKLSRHGGFDIKDNNGRTSLHYASLGGHAGCIKLILGESTLGGPGNEPQSSDDHKAGITKLLESRDDDNKTALELAAEKGIADSIQVLINMGADVNGTSPLNNRTALHLAVENNHKEAVVQLLAGGADLEKKESSDGRNCLHLAARKGYEDIIAVLLQKSPNIEERDNHQYTAFLLATYWEHPQAIKALLDGGANKDAKDQYENSAIHISFGLSSSIDTLKTLLERDVDVNAIDKDRETVLHYAAGSGRSNVVEALLDKKADINWRKPNGETALSLALEKGYKDIVRMLLKVEGVDVGIAGPNGYQPIHLSALAGDFDTTSALLKRGAVIEAMTDDGKTPLWLAVDNSNFGVVDTLLRHGANANAELFDGDSPLHVSLGNYMCWETVSPKSQEGQEIALVLLKHGADINALGSCGRTVLYRKSWSGNCDFVEQLLNFKPNLELPGGYYGSPLQAAILGGHESIVKRLLDAGVSVLTQDLHGWNPVICASRCQDLKIKEIFQEHGTNLRMDDPGPQSNPNRWSDIHKHPCIRLENNQLDAICG